MALAAVALAAVTLLSGCKDEKKAADQSASLADRVREAAEQAIRSGAETPAQVQFRGVQVYAQAMPQRMAVCGQVSPFADDANLFVPFVSVVTINDGTPRYQFEQRIATNTSEASRVYIAMANDCYDKGGPKPGPYQGAMPVPPLPDAIPDPAARSRPTAGPSPEAPVAPTAAPPSQPAAPIMLAPAPMAVPASMPVPTPGPAPMPQSAEPPAPALAPVPDQAPASGSVTMRQHGNLHAGPQGPVVQVVPQGTVMRIFAQAPGGWYQVGDTAPWGWVHESLVDRH